jgi:hypothetical protein
MSVAIGAFLDLQASLAQLPPSCSTAAQEFPQVGNTAIIAGFAVGESYAGTG